MRACHKYLIDDPLQRVTNPYWKYPKPLTRKQRIKQLNDLIRLVALNHANRINEIVASAFSEK